MLEKPGRSMRKRTMPRELEGMSSPTSGFEDYATKLSQALKQCPWKEIDLLARELEAARHDGRQLFLCGNGGSAATAIHLANDFLYGISKQGGPPLRVNALPANSSILTCLANDTSYDEVFSHQLKAFARKDDLLLVVSGSGNSPNIIAALDAARAIGCKSFALLGFNGGKALSKADVAIHFQVNDMQLAEDLHMITGHMIMQRLCGEAPAAS